MALWANTTSDKVGKLGEAHMALWTSHENKSWNYNFLLFSDFNESDELSTWPQELGNCFVFSLMDSKNPHVHLSDLQIFVNSALLY